MRDSRAYNQLVRIVMLSPQDEASKKKGDSSSPAGTQNDSPLENLSTYPLRDMVDPLKRMQTQRQVRHSCLTVENRRDACSTQGNK